MSGDVDRYIQRTYRYFYEDGLTEITVGLLLVTVGGALLAWWELALSPLVATILVIALPIAIVAGMSGARRLVQRAKEKVTFARTGYVAYRMGDPPGKRWFLLAPTLLLFVALLFLPDAFNRMQFAVAYLAAVCFGYFGYRLDLKRLYGVGIATFLSGVLLTLLVEDETTGSALVIAIIGLLLFLGGALALMRYLRRHPAPVGDEA